VDLYFDGTRVIRSFAAFGSSCPVLYYIFRLLDLILHVCDPVCICAVQKPAVPGDAVVNAELHLLERLLGRITKQGPSKRCM
jgi:threonine aldolase